MRHGIQKRYKEGCRCDECVGAVPHGHPNTYSNWGCRCDECRAGHRVRNRARYHVDVEKSRAKGRARYHETKVKNPDYLDRVREYSYRSRYGLSTVEYEDLMAGLCAICGGESQVLDHCHESGKVRGPLCRSCNTGIGQLRDDPELVQRAADYLRAHAEGG